MGRPVPGCGIQTPQTIGSFAAKARRSMSTMGIGLGSLLPFDAGQALMATEDSTADLYKVRADLGLEPRPFRETVRSYASKMA